MTFRIAQAADGSNVFAFHLPGRLESNNGFEEGHIFVMFSRTSRDLDELGIVPNSKKGRPKGNCQP